MIISRLGTVLELLTKADPQGFVKARFLFKDFPADVREIHVSDLRADGGSAEILRAVENLPPFDAVATFRSPRKGGA